MNILNQPEIELLSELYEEGKSPEEAIGAINQMSGKPFAESVGDAFRSVFEQLESAREDGSSELPKLNIPAGSIDGWEIKKVKSKED